MILNIMTLFSLYSMGIHNEDSYSNRCQVEPEHYFRDEYDSKQRWMSYWIQINELRKLKPRSILEIGIGNGLVSHYLRQRGFDITTMDIDERLKPDIVGSVLSIPFSSDSFEVVACFEVLEHLPYGDFLTALKEINRISMK